MTPLFLIYQASFVSDFGYFVPIFQPMQLKISQIGEYSHHLGISQMVTAFSIIGNVGYGRHPNSYPQYTDINIFILRGQNVCLAQVCVLTPTAIIAPSSNA
jgi:hypothetical protein